MRFYYSYNTVWFNLFPFKSLIYTWFIKSVSAAPSHFLFLIRSSSQGSDGNYSHMTLYWEKSVGLLDCQKISKDTNLMFIHVELLWQFWLSQNIQIFMTKSSFNIYISLLRLYPIVLCQRDLVFAISPKLWKLFFSITHTINLVIAGLSETNSTIYYPIYRHRKIKNATQTCRTKKG